MDEHRIGLKPIVRKIWAKRGERPTALVRPRYEWLYVWGFVQPETGERSFWLTESVNTESFGAILEAFARERAAQKATSRVAIDLVLDQAGWHTSGKLKVAEQVQLVERPP